MEGLRFESEHEVISGWIDALLLVMTVLLLVFFVPVLFLALLFDAVILLSDWPVGLFFFIIIAALMASLLAFIWVMALRRKGPFGYVIDGGRLIIEGSGRNGFSYDISKFSEVRIMRPKDASSSSLSGFALGVVDYTGRLTPFLVSSYARPLASFSMTWRDMMDREMVIISFRDKSNPIALLPKDKEGFVEALRERMG